MLNKMKASQAWQQLLEKQDLEPESLTEPKLTAALSKLVSEHGLQAEGADNVDTGSWGALRNRGLEFVKAEKQRARLIELLKDRVIQLSKVFESIQPDIIAVQDLDFYDSLAKELRAFGYISVAEDTPQDFYTQNGPFSEHGPDSKTGEAGNFAEHLQKLMDGRVAFAPRRYSMARTSIVSSDNVHALQQLQGWHTTGDKPLRRKLSWCGLERTFSWSQDPKITVQTSLAKYPSVLVS